MEQAKDQEWSRQYLLHPFMSKVVLIASVHHSICCHAFHSINASLNQFGQAKILWFVIMAVPARIQNKCWIDPMSIVAFLAKSSSPEQANSCPMSFSGKPLTRNSIVVTKEGLPLTTYPESFILKRERLGTDEMRFTAVGLRNPPMRRRTSSPG